jgi:hypothetical protein
MSAGARNEYGAPAFRVALFSGVREEVGNAVKAVTFSQMLVRRAPFAPAAM